MSTTDCLTKWSCTNCALSDNPEPSKCEMCAKKNIIVSLMYDLKGNGEYMNGFISILGDEFDNNIHEKQDEKQQYKTNTQIRNDSNYVSLFMKPHAEYMCVKGHQLPTHRKHFENSKCVECNAVNPGYDKTTNIIISYIPPNKQQILSFLNKYNVTQIPFGPSKDSHTANKWKNKGYDLKYPLHFAALTGNVNAINKLCTQKHINIEEKRTDDVDKTPLGYACWYNQLESVIALIKNGANPFPTPDKTNVSTYETAIQYKHKALINFYESFVLFMTGKKIKYHNMFECRKCYHYDTYYNKHLIDGTMKRYVYCKSCSKVNVKRIKLKQEHNRIAQNRIRKMLKVNSSISIDTLCEMRDVRALHALLKEIIAGGATGKYALYLLDIDHFKQINSALTHEGANEKLILMSKVLKTFDLKTKKEWENMGIQIRRLWVFRQGGDEFALVVEGYDKKEATHQKLYELLKTNINKIEIENMDNIKHITVSVGVCFGIRINNFEDMMKKADEAAEMVKENGRNNVRIYEPWKRKFYSSFDEITW